MNRRSATVYLATLLAAGCGGGGGGGAPAADGAGAPAPGPAAISPAPQFFAGPSSIAMWGDSLTPGVATAFTYMWNPPREIFNGGIIGQTSQEIAARATSDTSHRDWITTFWIGQNNDTQPEQIKADIAASVAHLAPGNNHFIVLSVVNKADGTEDRGSARYDTIIKLNSDLAAIYGDHFVDIRSFLVAQADPNIPEQAEEIRRDVPSSRLRVDEIHLSGDGDEVIAARLIDFIRAKGW